MMNTPPNSLVVASFSCVRGGYVFIQGWVVQFYSWFKFYLPLFKSYIPYPRWKENEIEAKDRNEPQRIRTCILLSVIIIEATLTVKQLALLINTMC